MLCAKRDHSLWLNCADWKADQAQSKQNYIEATLTDLVMIVLDNFKRKFGGIKR